MVFSGFSANEAQDVELQMGYLIGVRGFQLDEMGRFTGWSYASVWKPGENVAVCRKKKRVCVSLGNRYHTCGDACYELRPCEGDIEKCDHGFWGYFTNLDEQGGEALKSAHLAVIKGYGKTVIGTKGFRASKAAIMAVTLNSLKTDSSLIERVKRNYPDVKVFTNQAEMLAGYPIEDQTPGVPTDPKDPAFWEYDLSQKKTKTLRRVERAKVDIRLTGPVS